MSSTLAIVIGLLLCMYLAYQGVTALLLMPLIAVYYRL